MGSLSVKGCCSASNSSVNANFSLENALDFNSEDAINAQPFLNILEKCKISISFATNCIHISNAMPTDIPCCLTIGCPQVLQRPSTDFIFLIDLSKLTETEWLNAIKKSLELALEHADGNDRICVIGFNSQFINCTGLVAASCVGKLKIARVIKSLAGEGEQNIVNAINFAFQVLKSRKFINQHACVIFFSVSNSPSPLSAIEDIKALLSENHELDYSFNSFGLGPDYNPELLHLLSTGTYIHIQSPSFLSPVFKSFISTFFIGRLCNFQLDLSVTSMVPVRISKIYPHPKSIAFGETLSIVCVINVIIFSVDVRDTLQINAVVRYKKKSIDKNSSIEVFGEDWVINEIFVDEVTMAEFFKEKFLDVIQEMMIFDLEIGNKMLEYAIKEARASSIGKSDLLNSFLKEIENLQKELAVNNDWGGLNKTIIFLFIRKHCGVPIENSFPNKFFN